MNWQSILMQAGIAALTQGAATFFATYTTTHDLKASLVTAGTAAAISVGHRLQPSPTQAK